MKTKKITLRILIMAFICLIFTGSAISQEVRKHLTSSDLLQTTMKSAQKAPAHFATFLGRPGADRSLLKNGAENAAYFADTLIRYSIFGGSEKTVSSFNNEGQLLSTLNQVWIINYWADYSMITNVYDASGNLLTVTSQNYQSNAWVNYRMVTHTYDAAGNCLNTLGQEWDGSGWMNWGQSDYTYDGNGNVLTELFQEWDGAAWMYSSFDTYTYDGAGNQLTMLNKYWDGMAWSDNSLSTWTYDAAGHMLTYLDQMWDGMDWMNNFLQTQTFDGNGNWLTALEQGWNGEAWMNYFRATFSYDENNNRILAVFEECYDGMTWSNSGKNEWTYDATGNMLTFIQSSVDWNTGDWIYYMKSEYAYQAGMITTDGYTWTGTGWTIGDVYLMVDYKENGIATEFFNGGPAVQIKVYYSSFNVGIKDPENSQSGHFTIYPNPANNSITIIPADPAMKIDKLQLFDLAGKEHKITLAGNQVDISKLQNGTYFVKLTTSDGKTEVEKIVKQ